MKKANEVDLNDISISFDEKYHIFRGKPLYDKKFELVLSFHPPGVAAVRDRGESYHINLQGNPIYSKRFLRTFGYYESVASVEDESGWYHIDIQGISIYNERYKWVGNFQGGRCPVRDNHDNYFHININGIPAYSERYKYAGDFKYGIAVVYGQDGQAVHIDKEGKLFHNKKYKELGVFHKGFAIAKDSHGAFHINKNGEPLYKERYKWVEPFYNGFSFICKYNDEKVIINEDGQVIQEIINKDSEIIKISSRNRLMGMLVSYWKTQILFSIAKLEILDYVKKGYNTFDQLLNVIKIPRPALDMIVKVLKLWNFISVEDGCFHLNFMGELLTEDEPYSLKYATLMWGDEHYIAMSRLYEALKNYKPQFKEIFHQEIFHYFNINKEKGAIFNKAMREYSLDYDDLLSFYNFNDTKDLMDVGSGSGRLLENILRKYTDIEKGILFDLPSVIEIAQNSIPDSLIKRKIEFISGNFFEEIPIKADTIIMSRVLHDWNDGNALKILNNINDSLNENGKLLLFELVVPDDPIVDIGITLNFNLLVCTGGRERTRSEIQEILKLAGFQISCIKRGNSIISLILAEKNKNEVSFH